MPAAKPTPLEELAIASARGELTPEETARRYRAITGYQIQETVPNPRALMLLSGTTRPAKARAKLNATSASDSWWLTNEPWRNNIMTRRKRESFRF